MCPLRYREAPPPPLHCVPSQACRWHEERALHSCKEGILEVARRACTADIGDRPELQVRGVYLISSAPELRSSERIIDFV